MGPVMCQVVVPGMACTVMTVVSEISFMTVTDVVTATLMDAVTIAMT